MPQCILCPIVQAKLNDGKLCKLCFSNKDDDGEIEIKPTYDEFTKRG